MLSFAVATNELVLRGYRSIVANQISFTTRTEFHFLYNNIPNSLDIHFKIIEPTHMDEMILKTDLAEVN